MLTVDIRYKPYTLPEVLFNSTVNTFVITEAQFLTQYSLPKILIYRHYRSVAVLSPIKHRMRFGMEQISGTCYQHVICNFIQYLWSLFFYVCVPIMFMMTSSNGNILRVFGPLCEEFTVTGEFPTQRSVTRSFDVFFDLCLNKRLSKQLLGWWFETPSRSL